MHDVYANGDYLGMNSENIYVDHLDLVGNYVFDGAKNVEVHNSRLVSKDAFMIRRLAVSISLGIPRTLPSLTVRLRVIKDYVMLTI